MIIPYKVKFILDENESDHLSFDSNEKPCKGDLYSIEQDGELTPFIIKEITKVVIRNRGTSSLEYQCAIAKYEPQAKGIGFK